MKFTIREINNGIATVDFEDGAWAEVPMNADDTEEDFRRNAAQFATKKFVAPDWATPEASLDGATVERETPPEEFNPSAPMTEEEQITAQWYELRVQAYGSTASQIEFITENGLEAWQEEVALIKKNFPDPDLE